MKGILTKQNSPWPNTFQQLQRRRCRDIFGQYHKVIGRKRRAIMAMRRVGCEPTRAPVALPDDSINAMARQRAGGLVDHLLTAGNHIAAERKRENDTRHIERTFAKNKQTVF